eukprot:6185211-Pleurochrysis_carterae.AAC.2
MHAWPMPPSAQAAIRPKRPSSRFSLCEAALCTGSSGGARVPSQNDCSRLLTHCGLESASSL